MKEKKLGQIWKYNEDTKGRKGVSYKVQLPKGIMTFRTKKEAIEFSNKYMTTLSM